MQYGCTHLRVVYDRAVMDRPFPNCYPGLRQALEDELSRRLPRDGASSWPTQANPQTTRHDADALLARIQQNLVFMLPKGAPDLETLADTMRLSRRSLQRQLEERGTTFSEMLDQVRRRQAALYVARPDLPLPEVASLLGFSEQSALQRAFKRWFGCTPGEFRRHGGGTALGTGAAVHPGRITRRSATATARRY
jgi:AraC-like DNA-binding protein